MPRITGYHHLSLSVTDLARSAEWYRNVLGFSVVAEFEGGGFRRARLVHPDADLRLTLTCHDAGARTPFSELNTGMDHVAFLTASVDDIEVWKRRFEDLGVEHSEVKPAAAGAGALITLRDPDNIQLEVFFPAPPDEHEGGDTTR